jgi:hypothetical protein
MNKEDKDLRNGETDSDADALTHGWFLVPVFETSDRDDISRKDVKIPRPSL